MTLKLRKEKSNSEKGFTQFHFLSLIHEIYSSTQTLPIVEFNIKCFLWLSRIFSQERK